MIMHKPLLLALLLTATVAGCEKPPPAPPQPRPVRTVTVEPRTEGQPMSLTGQVRAKDEASVAFRLDGRMIARLVGVGDTVAAGQVVARLDPQHQENSL